MKWNVNNFKFNLWRPEPVKKLKVSDFKKAKKALQAADIRRPRALPCTHDTAIVFINKLKKRGFVQLGQGCFSTVLWKKGDRVIKVNRSNPDAWLDYVYWAAQKGYAGGLAPKVYSYKKIGDFYVAVMEKIEHCAYKIDVYDDRYMYTNLLAVAAAYGNKMAGKMLDMAVPGGGKFAYDLKDHFKGHRLDLHNENIMFRADGSMVIVDPVSHPSTLTINRLKAGDFGLQLAIR